MLALHELTLFWWDYSSKKEKTSGLVKNWLTNVTATPGSKSKQSSTRSSTVTITGSGSASRHPPASSFTSVSTGLANSEVSQAPDDMNADHLSGLDVLELEDDGEERSKAIASPVKGRKRLTTAVCVLLMLRHV